MNKLFKILILASIFVCPSFLFAQSLSGLVVDSPDEQPISFANSVLLLPDSTVYKTIGTDDSGYFKLSPIVAGDYILGLSFVGFEPYFQNITIDNADINIGTVKLQPKIFDEVVVNGERVIRKADHQIILPSAQQLKLSNNGYNLLDNLQLSRIFIDPITKTVTKAGQGDVVLCINGKQVDKSEVMSLDPANVLRIEYFDESTMRFYESAGVINFIIKRAESGGRFSIEAQNLVKSKVIMSNNFIDGKYTVKKSEFSMSAFVNNRESRPHRNSIQKFIYPDREIERKEIGIPARFITNVLNLNMNYNLLETDKYYFSASLSDLLINLPSSYTDRQGIIFQTEYNENNQDPISSSFQFEKKLKRRENTPSLDLFYNQKLNNGQEITLNVVGTFIESRNRNIYKEWTDENIISDLLSEVKGKKYSLIGEGTYTKPIGKGQFSAGLKHNQSYTKNSYQGDIIEQVDLKYAQTYAYLQYLMKYKNVTYTGAIGEARTFSSQDSKSNTDYTFRPMVNISYQSPYGFYARLRSLINSVAPSLSSLSNVEQIIDPLQIRRGNPDLKTETVYDNSINIGLNKNIFNIDFKFSYDYSKNKISTSVFLEDDIFVLEYQNQNYLSSIRFDANLQIKPFGNYLIVTVNPTIRRFFSKGSNYYHTYTAHSINTHIAGNYDNWSIVVSAWPRYNFLRGEQIFQTERGNRVSIGYNKIRWSAGVSFFNMFGKFRQEDINLYSVMPSRTTIYQKDFEKNVLLNFSCNFEFGKLRKSGKQTLKNSDRDSGILSN